MSGSENAITKEEREFLRAVTRWKNYDAENVERINFLQAALARSEAGFGQARSAGPGGTTPDVSKRYLRAYYHEFTPTGRDEVDAVLEAVARAGRAYHSTAEWDEPIKYGKDGPNFWDFIQERADASAVKLAQAEAREKALREALAFAVSGWRSGERPDCGCDGCNSVARVLSGVAPTDTTKEREA